MLLQKDKLNNIEVLFSKALIDSYISHGEFIGINNVLREYNKMKEEIKNPETSVEYTICKQWKHIVSILKKYTANENSSFRKTDQDRWMLFSNCADCGKKK